MKKVSKIHILTLSLILAVLTTAGISQASQKSGPASFKDVGGLEPDDLISAGLAPEGPSADLQLSTLEPTGPGNSGSGTVVGSIVLPRQSTHEICVPATQQVKWGKKREHSAKVALYKSFASQGDLLFINGPDKSFARSQALIHNLCERGFSIISFDVHTRGAKTTIKDYEFFANHLTSKIFKHRKSKLLVYGWEKGAEVAVQLASRYSGRFSRLLLETPELSSQGAWKLSHVRRSKVQVFACQMDKHVPWQSLRRTSNFSVYMPTTGSCHRSLKNLPNAEASMVDFIESDFAGVKTDSWYWTRKI